MQTLWVVNRTTRNLVQVVNRMVMMFILACSFHLHEDESMAALCDIDPRVLAPLENDDFNVVPDALPPMHSRLDIIPIYDVNRRVPSTLEHSVHCNESG